MIPSVTQAQALTAVRSFLLGILPLGTAVIKGEINRVPEPQGSDFIVMTPIMTQRIETNTDTPVDAVFTGAIAGTVLTITAVNPSFTGQLGVGSALYGPNVAAGTTIQGLGSGSGGLGTYNVTPSQTAVSGTIAAGVIQRMAPTEMTLQLDVHGPNSTDNANMIVALWRSGYAYVKLAPVCAPLFADDARQRPFINAEQQFEFRWSIDAHIQINPVIATGQEFADEASVTPVSVDAAYPA